MKPTIDFQPPKPAYEVRAIGDELVLHDPAFPVEQQAYFNNRRHLIADEHLAAVKKEVE